jgi:hypothetical protein
MPSKMGYALRIYLESGSTFHRLCNVHGWIYTYDLGQQRRDTSTVFSDTVSESVYLDVFYKKRQNL